MRPSRLTPTIGIPARTAVTSSMSTHGRVSTDLVCTSTSTSLSRTCFVSWLRSLRSSESRKQQRPEMVSISDWTKRASIAASAFMCETNARYCRASPPADGCDGRRASIEVALRPRVRPLGPPDERRVST